MLPDGEARTVLGMNLKLDEQFGDYQDEIYLNGLSGVLPTMPMTSRSWKREHSRCYRRRRCPTSPAARAYRPVVLVALSDWLSRTCNK